MRRFVQFAVPLLAIVAVATWASAQNVQITQGPRIEQVTGNSAVIAWSTNVNASTVLRYGTDAKNLNQTAQAPWGGLTHRVTLSNLQPGTVYYFDVESGQAQGTGGSVLSPIQSFITPGQGPAMSGTGLQASCGNPTMNSFDVMWQTNRPGSTVVKYGTDPNNLNQTAQAPWGEKNHKVTISNLQPGTTYFLQVQTGAEQGTGASEQSGVMACATKSQ
jgi:phosphodiesterase/alkaline phosphatase D-like protein